MHKELGASGLKRGMDAARTARGRALQGFAYDDDLRGEQAHGLDRANECGEDLRHTMTWARCSDQSVEGSEDERDAATGAHGAGDAVRRVGINLG